MSKKDFIALADMIRDFNNDNIGWPGPDGPSFDSRQIRVLADFCAGQNPNFNRDRWLDYIAGKCGPSGGSK